MPNKLRIFLCLAMALMLGGFSADAPLAQPEQEARARAMFDEIRCVVCQSESIADSPAQVAADMRRLVRERIAAGDRADAITSLLVSRYGDAILMRPPFKPVTWLLWLGPLAILFSAIALARTYLSPLPFRETADFVTPHLRRLQNPGEGYNHHFKRVRKKQFFSLCLCILLAALATYAACGSPRTAWRIAKHHERWESLRQEILRDSEAVKTDPHNLGAWVRLGANFMESEQYGAAANAFKQAVRLSRGDPQLILAYARAMILGADGNVSDHAKKSLKMVLLQEPENAEARYWLIVRQLQDGHTAQAMRAMKKLYGELPADSPLKATIDRQIGRVP